MEELTGDLLNLHISGIQLLSPTRMSHRGSAVAEAAERLAEMEPRLGILANGKRVKSNVLE
jgi:hypothetical protein